MITHGVVAVLSFPRCNLLRDEQKADNKKETKVDKENDNGQRVLAVLRCNIMTIIIPPPPSFAIPRTM